MQFKTQDLLVTVLPKAELTNPDLARICFLRTFICRNPTFYCFHGSFDCGLFRTLCGFCSFQGTAGCGFLKSCGPGLSACDPTKFCGPGSGDPYIIGDLEDLAALKEELQKTISRLDEIAKEVPPAINSAAVVAGLEEALSQISARKY